MRTVLPLLLLCAVPAQAQSPMTAAEFAAYASGNTIFFADRQGPYGAEEYFPSRRVLWSGTEGECLHGHWYAQADRICFAYEGFARDQCWHFFRDADGLRAEFLAEGSDFELFEIARNTRPLDCPGPKVGS